MDEHFMSAPAHQNLPLLMALFGVWNRNFLGASSHNIAPYASPLGKFASFLQQMDMESNGKRTHSDGTPATVDKENADITRPMACPRRSKGTASPTIV